jgi:molybdopterin/thiamine biosynthesis adenylyltransferase
MDSVRVVKRVVIVGAGNIGSHLAPMIARIAEVGRILVIDRDRYEQKNLTGQSITVAEVGGAKARVQAAALRRISPEIEVSSFVGEFERVPLGWLRGDLILGCLDSRRGRQSVNEAAFHLGIPWIDSGVHPDGLLARVNVYLPGADRPCIECAWDENDYRNIEQEYPCGSGKPSTVPPPPSTPATNAPAALGALAAALQAIEAGKILTGRDDLVVGGRQIQIDASHHTHYVTAFRRNHACRFGDHAPWTLIDLPSAPSKLSPRDLADRLPGSPGPRDCAFSIEGRSFARALTCSGCGRRRAVWRLVNLRPGGDGPCRSCGGRIVVTGVDRLDLMEGSELPARELDRPLGALGVRPGDIVRVVAGEATARFVIGGDSR